MDFENFVRKLSRPSEDLSGDSYYGSEPESVRTEYSDEEYLPNTRKITRKRMQTFGDDNHSGKFRRVSTTSSVASDNGLRKIERLPTRRPDPSVHNRNALMARENRKKKKQHVQLLENELKQNRRLIKRMKQILKEKDRTLDKLTHETLYLRSIIANKTDIMSLLTTIKGNKLPLTSSVLSFVADNNAYRSNGSEASFSPTTTSTGEDEKENDFDLGFPNSSISDELNNGNWKSVLNDEDICTSMSFAHTPLEEPDADLLSNVKNEHNYYLNNNNDAIKRKDRENDVRPGICLHLSGGRVSLEFCAACHSSSQNAWLEEI